MTTSISTLKPYMTSCTPPYPVAVHLCLIWLPSQYIATPGCDYHAPNWSPPTRHPVNWEPAVIMISPSIDFSMIASHWQSRLWKEISASGGISQIYLHPFGILLMTLLCYFVLLGVGMFMLPSREQWRGGDENTCQGVFSSKQTRLLCIFGCAFSLGKWLAKWGAYWVILVHAFIAAMARHGHGAGFRILLLGQRQNDIHRHRVAFHFDHSFMKVAMQDHSRASKWCVWSVIIQDKSVNM